MTIKIPHSPLPKDVPKYMDSINEVLEKASTKNKRGLSFFKKPLVKNKNYIPNEEFENLKCDIEKNWDNIFSDHENYVEAFVIDDENKTKLSNVDEALRNNYSVSRSLFNKKGECIKSLKYESPQDLYVESSNFNQQEFAEKNIDLEELYYLVHTKQLSKNIIKPKIKSLVVNDQEITKEIGVPVQKRYVQNFSISYHISNDNAISKTFDLKNSKTNDLAEDNKFIKKNKSLDVRQHSLGSKDLNPKFYTIFCFASSVFAISFCGVRLFCGGINLPFAILLSKLFM